MRMLAIILAVFLSFVVLASAQADSYGIVPGKSIGPVQIGMAIDDLKAALGPETTVTNDGANLFYAWKSGAAGYLVALVKDRKVIVAVVSNDPQYVTYQGLHTGLTRDEVLNAMGKPSQTAVKDKRVIHEDGTEGSVSVEVLYYHGLIIWIPQGSARGVKAGVVWQIGVVEAS